MQLDIDYGVIEKLANQTNLHLNTCLVIELKDEMQSIIVESLLWGKKISLLDAFWIAAKSLGFEIS